jgi:PAS domain S-box-containing protein
VQSKRAGDASRLQSGVSEAQIRIALDQIQDYAVILLDRTGNITWWNSGAERIFGYSESDALGLTFAMLFTPEDRAQGAPEEELRTAALTGRAADEHWHLRRDGSRFWASGITTAYANDPPDSPSENREISGFIKVARDLTAHKLHEQETAQSRDTIDELKKRLQRMVSETHHRVKNNLQVIAAMIELLTAGNETSVPVSDVANLGRHVAALAAIHDLLTTQSRGAGEISQVSILDVLTTLLPPLRQTMRGRQLRLNTEDVSLPISTATSIAILVNELVTNAVKHGEGEIVLSLEKKGQVARLTVADEGTGFPPGFDPTACTRMGLELIQVVATHDLQGRVTFSNGPNGGACVVVEFPMPKEDVKSSEA